MRLHTLRAHVLFCVAKQFLPICAASYAEDDAWSQFLQFMEHYGRRYSSSAELDRRFAIFKSNLVLIDDRNGRGDSARHGVNRFSDLSPKEFLQRYTGYHAQKGSTSSLVRQLAFEPLQSKVASIDWREKDAVTPVKDQGRCGGCWAFSAAQQLESATFLKYGFLPKLSTQQLISCDPYDGGCSGGDTITAYEYVNKVGGLELNETYPYTSGAQGDSGNCSVTPSQFNASISEAFFISRNATEETNMLHEIGTTPMSVCVDAEIWQTYKSGVITNTSGCTRNLNHCVQVVGFNSSANYWIVRNSWGSEWGNQGYVWVAQGANICGIAEQATIVTASIAPRDVFSPRSTYKKDPSKVQLLPGGCPMDGCDADLSRQLGTSLYRSAKPTVLWQVKAHMPKCAITPGSNLCCGTEDGLLALSPTGSLLWRKQNFSGHGVPLVLTSRVSIAANQERMLAVEANGHVLWSMSGGSDFSLTVSHDGILGTCSGNTLALIVGSGLPFASTQLNGTCVSIPVIKGSRVYIVQKANGALLLSAIDFHESLGLRITVAWEMPLKGRDLLAAPMLVGDVLLLPTVLGVQLISDDGTSGQVLAPMLPKAMEIAADPRNSSAWLVRAENESLVLERYSLDHVLLQHVNVSSLLSTHGVTATSRLGVCFSTDDAGSISLLLGIEDGSGPGLLALRVGDQASASLLWRQQLPSTLHGQVLLASKDPRRILPANDMVIAPTADHITALSLSTSWVFV